MNRLSCLGASAFVVLLFCITSPAKGGQSCSSGSEDIAMALRTAYEHFDKELSTSMRVGPQIGLKGFLARMENYQVRISVETDQYILSFTPSKYPGGTVKGGGAEYVVKKCTYEIESVRPYM